MGPLPRLGQVSRDIEREVLRAQVGSRKVRDPAGRVNARLRTGLCTCVQSAESQSAGDVDQVQS